MEHCWDLPFVTLACLAPTPSNSSQNPDVLFWSFEFRKSGCTETIQITSGDFQSYTQALTSPYDDEYGRQFVSCQHRFEGIPTEAYVSVSLHYTYDLTLTSYSRKNEITNLTISNGTASQNFSSISEYIYIQSTTGITFDIISREDDRWRFVYIFRGKWNTHQENVKYKMFPYTVILVLVRLLLYPVMFSCMELS